ncbi:hypothetical protein JOB18_000190 [Solea senegalensis]|uniref:PH domain-containing protein n=1 Tax=Solea senegalensis TaxID=28829 RepID=A0AAV6SDB1_SOLSE|nr:hypothetical protein JOB18_000190 [Solea senegalensis]
MNVSGIRGGMLRMYGGFIFKRWKRRFLLLTAEGSLLVSRDASSPPDQLVLLHRSCEAIVEGKEILDLPRLPSNGCRDCCFALILYHNKYVLLLAESAAECRSERNFALFQYISEGLGLKLQCVTHQWLNVLKKVKKSLSSSLSPCQRHQVGPPHITLCDLVPEAARPVSDAESPNQKGKNSPQGKFAKGGSHSCLRHGNISNAEAVKAVYVLMGGAAASSALGAGASSHLEAKAHDLSVNVDFSEVGGARTYHSGSPALDSPHYNTFDFDVAHSEFDAFDCGGFTF